MLKTDHIKDNYVQKQQTSIRKHQISKRLILKCLASLLQWKSRFKIVALPFESIELMR